MTTQTNRSGRKLILVLVDGCRWDYPDQSANYQGFKTLENEGVRAEYMDPIFPSNSYPNWYTIVTGLYAENHGFIDNFMYDGDKENFFYMAPTPSDASWWQLAEPLWITAQKNGINTAVYRWDGSQFERDGVKPKICTAYNLEYDYDKLNSQFRDIFTEVVTMMANDEIELALVYHDPVDLDGHTHGPDSAEVKQSFTTIDKLLLQLQYDISEKNLRDEVNIVVLSDHGMISLNEKTVNKIDLNPYANDIQYMLNGMAFAMIMPIADRKEKLYNDLKATFQDGCHVYLKEDIPEKYRIKRSNRTLPIVLIADPGSAILQISNTKKSIPFPKECKYKGGHGYDPERSEDMRTIFYASGPALKKSFRSPPIMILDVYNLACHILGITPLKNDGSWDRVKDMLEINTNK